MGIYKIEKEKRVRVKVRKGPWYGIRMGDHMRGNGKLCFCIFASFFFFLAAVFFAGNDERNELEYNNSKTCVSD